MTRFFEPNFESVKPVRWAIERQDGDPSTLAALWDIWKPKVGETLHSFSMLTINADGHPVMGRFHAPENKKLSLVIVPPDRRADWLAAEDLRDFMNRMAADAFTSSPAPLPPRKKASS